MNKKIAFAAALVAATIATPALAGTGSAYSTAERCTAALASGQYTQYTPGMVQTSRRELMTGMRSAGFTGPTCIEERVRVAEIDGARANDHRTVWAYVIVPGEVIITDGIRFMDMRCGNDARNPVRPQVAVCTDCTRPAQPVLAPVPVARPQVQVGLIAPATATAPVTYRAPREPLRVAFIPVGMMPAAGSVYVGGNSNVTYNYGNPGTTPNTPPFGGVTQPPAGNGFGGTTQPPAGNPETSVPPPLFGGTTGAPQPLPGPVFGGNGFGGGNTGVQAPVFNGGAFNGTTNGIQAPVFNGGPLIVNGNDFGGTTSNTFTGSTGVIGAPVSGGSNFNFNNNNTVVGGVQGPVSGGNTTTTTTTTTTGTFGGNTN